MLLFVLFSKLFSSNECKKIATFVLSCKSTNPYTRYFLALLLFLREAALISQFFVQQILVASSRMGFLPYHSFSKKEITLFCMCYQHNMVEQCRYAQNSSKDNNQKHSSRYKCNLAGPHLVLMTTHFGDKEQPTELQRPL